MYSTYIHKYLLTYIHMDARTKKCVEVNSRRKKSPQIFHRTLFCIVLRIFRRLVRGKMQFVVLGCLLTLIGLRYSIKILKNQANLRTTVCSINIVFFCLSRFSSVSVCVHTPGRQNTSAAAELTEFRKITTF